MLKLTFSGLMLAILLGREDDLVVGSETAAFTVAAMVKVHRKGGGLLSVRL